MNKLQKLIDQTTQKKIIHGVSFRVDTPNGSWEGASGNFKINDPYFIASTTKLFTSALIFQLEEKGKLNLSDKITSHLDNKTVNNLHLFNNKDYSTEITIEQLLSHTSGIPDYFHKKMNNGFELEKDLTRGNDRFWTFEQAIDWSKDMKPNFYPSQPKKAQYSDTNYQLLGKIIENKFGNSLNDIIQNEICDKIGLKSTYLYDNVEDKKPKPLFFKQEALFIPKAMTSFGADGSIVSNASEMMVFLKSFIRGELFSQEYIDKIQKWNKIFFPLEAGIGIQRFNPPWYFSPFKKIPEMIGHSGLSGAFAYYVPEKEIYLTGTVNQIARPGNSFQLMIKALYQLV